MIKLRRHSIVLMAMVILFAAPGLFAYVFFHHPTWLGASPTNRGVLLTPPSLLTSMDQSKKWRLILWNPRALADKPVGAEKNTPRIACDSKCMHHMDELARVRLALGRRLYHVDTYLVLDENVTPLSAAELNVLRDQDSHVLVLSAHDQSDRMILGKKPAIYVVSPENYVILKYAMVSQPDDIFHDIKQLVNDE
ncbi:MAG: hypothetical protein Q8R24_02435 [Legionellaceae bacterium]|nr:hypothetical protein [Legionellaceae bacterium]